MIKILNLVAMAATIAFGMIGWFFPAYTMGVLDLALVPGSTLGLSEIRAASGALFVGVGVGALLLRSPTAFFMVGCVYAGAGVGRLTSILLDGSGTGTSISFLLTEAVLAGFLLWANREAAAARLVR